MKNPCKNCPIRKIGCHSICQPYKEFSEANIKRREEEFKERQNFNAIRGVSSRVAKIASRKKDEHNG